jgi:hypothetical protein
MRAVYTHYERGGVWAHKDLMLGGGSARKPQTHTMARRVLTEHGTTIHTGHTSQRGCTWAHREGAAGGGGGLGAGHTNTNTWQFTPLCTRNSTQHCLREGSQGGGGSRPRWTHNTAQRLQGANHTRTRYALAVRECGSIPSLCCFPLSRALHLGVLLACIADCDHQSRTPMPWWLAHGTPPSRVASCSFQPCSRNTMSVKLEAVSKGRLPLLLWSTTRRTGHVSHRLGVDEGTLRGGPARA